jgi:hypothetical protein
VIPEVPNTASLEDGWLGFTPPAPEDPLTSRESLDVSDLDAHYATLLAVGMQYDSAAGADSASRSVFYIHPSDFKAS